MFFERAAGGADRRRVGDADHPHAGAVDLVDGLRRRGGGHHVGALAQHVVRPERDALLALLVHRHERDVDIAGFERVDGKPGIGKQHGLDRHVELLAQRVREIGGDAARLVVLLHDEEDRHRGREHERDAQLAGGIEFFHGTLVGGRAARRAAGEHQSAGFQDFHGPPPCGARCRCRAATRPFAVDYSDAAGNNHVRYARAGVSMNIIQSAASVRSLAAAQLKDELVEEDLARQAPEDGRRRVPVPARDLLALGGNHPGDLPASCKARRRCSRSAISMSRTSAPGATSRGVSSGASTISTRRPRCLTSIDLVRLATSAVLADEPRHQRLDAICERSCEGYRTRL